MKMCKAVSAYVEEAYSSFLPLQLSFVIKGLFFSYGFCRQFEYSDCWFCFFCRRAGIALSLVCEL